MNNKKLSGAIFLLFFFAGTHFTVWAEDRSFLPGSVVRSASELDYPPLAQIRQDGSAAGFSVDLLKAVAREMGLQLDISVGPWHKIKQDLAEGKLDVLPMVSYSSQRDTLYDFTIPYLRLYGTIFVREGERTIQSEADLKGKQIITMRGDTAHEYALRMGLSDNLILTDSFEQAVKLLSSGKHDAVMVQQLIGLELLKKLHITNVVDINPYRISDIKPSGAPLSQFEQKFCIAVREGDRQLLSRLNEGLSIVMTNGTYEQLFHKWMDPILPHQKLSVKLAARQLAVIIAPILFILIATALYFSRREVNRKTRSLRKEIEDRTRAVQKLKKSETHINSIFRVAPTGIGVVIDREIMDVNTRMCEITGYTKKELIGKNARFLYPSDKEYEYVGTEKYGQIRHYGTGTVETRWKHKRGHVFNVLLSSTPIEFNDWSRGITFTALDITKRKRFEEKLKYAQFSVDHASDAIFWIDVNAQLVYVNDTACNMLGFTRTEMLSMSITDLDPKLGNDNWPTHWSDLRQNRTQMFETRLIGKAGRIIHVEVSENYLEYDGREYNHACARDITERRQAEKERLSLERQMLHAQKLESLGVLAGGIAHDFNNILMTILGNVDISLQDMSPVSPIRQHVKEIEKATRRAAGLSKQMLAYSGRGKFVIEPIHVNEFVNEMGHMLEVSISKKAVLKYHFADNLPMFEGDATQIQQVIMNLITNASEAIGDKSGVIAISTGAMDCDDAYLNTANFATRVSLDESLQEGIYVYFEVADTGCGMDKDTMEKLFDPFFTTKFTGRGLGMAAVLGIVRGHKGAIKIYSEVGKGTTIKTLFPAAADDAVAGCSQNGTPADVMNWHADGLILIADDEESICAVGKLMLERVGFEVLTAADGREAVDVFRDNAERIDCVVLDLTMPHLNGDQAFSELRRIKPDVKVILSSGYNEQDATQRFAGKGLTGFLQKPYESVSLVAKLREVLAGTR